MSSRDLTAVAREGYNGNPNTHLSTSPNWYAHRLGAWLHDTGRPIPTSGVRMSRGAAVRVNDLVYKFNDDGVIERMS